MKTISRSTKREKTVANVLATLRIEQLTPSPNVISGLRTCMTGKTTIDGRGIRQDWLTPKEFSWHEISQVRLVRMPLVPRLVVMTGRGPFKAVHGGNKTLVDAFREVESFYRR